MKLICKNCKKEFSDRRSTKKYCTKLCYKQYIGRPDIILNIVNKRKKTSIEKYGVDNPAKCQKVKEKAKNTCIKKYGKKCFSKTKKYKIQSKNTCIKKYGVDHHSQNVILKEKNRLIKKSLNYNRFMSDLSRWGGKYKLVDSKEEYTKKSHFDEYSFKCLSCNNVFNDTIFSGNIPRCLKCFPPTHGISKEEEELSKFIKGIINDKIYRNDKTLIYPLELDIYIPSKKLAIEFNGNYWHSEHGGKKYKNYHLNKQKKCEENGLRLIHIFEDEWINKKDIVKSRLCHILHSNSIKTKKINARNCIISNITTKQKDDFLEENHIQGKDKSQIKMGSFYKNELVAVMTLGKLRLSLGNKIKENHVYEMYRFCIKQNVNITGIANKLLKFLIESNKVNKIVSYADKRWSNSHSFYSKIGFKLISETGPNYWYTKSYQKREHRFKYAKHTLNKKLKNFNPSLTEWENMQLNGYDRIWDCGNLRYEMMI